VNIFIDHRQHNANLQRILFNNSTGNGAGNGNEQVIMKPIRDGACCVCSDENGWADNPLVYCEGPNCQVAVHQGLCVCARAAHAHTQGAMALSTCRTGVGIARDVQRRRRIRSVCCVLSRAVH
jgi:hypothetical protein